MRKISLIVSLLVVLLAFTSCQEPQNTVPGSVKSISVRVIDQTDAKTITPEGNVDVSHYKITVKNEDENINTSSDYLEKGKTFSVTNVPTGIWTATVDAYVLNNADYIKVATGTSAETRVKEGETAVLTVELNELDDSLSGDITVTLDMPAELDDNGTEFYYTYTIAGTGQRSSYSYRMDTPVKGTVDGSGNGTFTIDADAVSPQLYQGSYLLTVTAFDKETESSSDVVRKGVEIMRLVNGLGAKGTINLNSQIINEEGFQVSIKDKIGDKLDLGTASYDNFAKDTTITIDYNGIATSTPVDVYVDGVKVTNTTDYTATPGDGNVAFKFNTIDVGRHIVTFILDEADTELGVGSLTVEVNIPAEIQFVPQESLAETSGIIDGHTLYLTFNSEDMYELFPSEELGAGKGGMAIDVKVDGLDEFLNTYYSEDVSGKYKLIVDDEEYINGEYGEGDETSFEKDKFYIYYGSSSDFSGLMRGYIEDDCLHQGLTLQNSEPDTLVLTPFITWDMEPQPISGDGYSSMVYDAVFKPPFSKTIILTYNE